MSTFDSVAEIIAETCNLERDAIKPESNAINDLNIDSLDFLDVTFAIDRKFGISCPSSAGPRKLAKARPKSKTISCSATSSRRSTSS